MKRIPKKYLWTCKLCGQEYVRVDSYTTANGMKRMPCAHCKNEAFKKRAELVTREEFGDDFEKELRRIRLLLLN